MRTYYAPLFRVYIKADSSAVSNQAVSDYLQRPVVVNGSVESESKIRQMQQR